MRNKIVTVLAGGVLGITGVTLASPALAAVGADSAATAVDERVSRLKAALSGLVKDKTLTQAQADKVADTLADAKLGGGPHGFGRHGGGHFRDLSTAASALGMTEAELRTALQSGKTLAAIAKDKGVSVDTLIAKLVAAAKAHLAEEVKEGRLTQAEADAKIATLKARITERVNSVRPNRPGHGPGEMRGGTDSRDGTDGTDGTVPGSATSTT